MLCAAGLALTGCASTVRVQSLATGQADVQAYQLFGTRLDDLRGQLARLCPRGAEVLRVADAHQQTVAASDGRVARWVAALTEQATPQNSRAQMLVLCAPESPAARTDRLAAAGRTSAAAPASPVLASNAAVLPRLPPPSTAPVTGYDE